VESRRRLYGMLTTAVVLRALIEGLDEAGAAERARPWAEKLKAAGGVPGGAVFGPRVEAALARLK